MWPSSLRGRTSGWTRNKQPTAIDVVVPHESAFVAITAVVQELLGLGRSLDLAIVLLLIAESCRPEQGEQNLHVAQKIWANLKGK
jgi:hypothetical protein